MEAHRTQDRPVPSSKQRILLGEITSVHGIRGEIVIRSYAESADGLGDYGPLEDETGTRQLEIEVIRVTPKGVIAAVKSVGDRTAAEKLKGTKLYVARDKLPEVEGNAYYHVDLIGLDAVDTAGVTFGKIIAVHNFGAGDLIEVAIAGTKDTVFVPFTDACVPNVDIAAQAAVVVLPVSSAHDEPDASAGPD